MRKTIDQLADEAAQVLVDELMFRKGKLIAEHRASFEAARQTLRACIYAELLKSAKMLEDSLHVSAQAE